MKRNRCNKNLKNSKGISSKEYLLGSNTGRFQNKDLNNDFDYLDKLSPEELAWLAEVQAAVTSGQLVDANIVGLEDARNLNDQVESRRPAWRGEKARRSDAMVHLSASIDYNGVKDGHAAYHSSDSYENMLEEIEDSIDAYWREKHS